MGLLDDLKQQAETLREQQQVSQATHNQNLLQAHTKLKDALRYWMDMFNSLNTIKPVVRRYYYLEGGVTNLENLLQSDYIVNARHLTVDHHDYVESIELRFRCAGDSNLILEKQSAPMVERLRSHLWANNLRFEVKEVRNERDYIERATFTVKSEVPVTITITADLANAQFRFVTRNLEKLGEYTYLYDFDEFGNDTMEELGKVILARPNTLRTMGRHQLAMSNPISRVSRDLPVPEATPHQPAPDAAPGEANSPAKGLLGNIKSLLTR